MNDRLVSTVSFSKEASKVLRSVRPKNLSYYVSLCVLHYVRDNKEYQKVLFSEHIENARIACREAFGKDIDVRMIKPKD